VVAVALLVKAIYPELARALPGLLLTCSTATVSLDQLHALVIPLAGGALIGLAASLFVVANGRIAGISGLIGSLLQRGGEASVKALFLLGLLIAPLLWGLFTALPQIEFKSGWLGLIAAGVLVGIGTRYGSGCTSGHGVCGISRLSPRSMAPRRASCSAVSSRCLSCVICWGLNMSKLTAFIAGLLFGLGLLLAGMANPGKVLAFLDLAGAWDPSLGLVMVGAIGVAIGPLTWARRQSSSLLGRPMQLPIKRELDRRLIGGSLLFGIGWGIAGICPGPAVAILLTGHWQAILFMLAMLGGMLLFTAWRIGANVDHVSAKINSVLFDNGYIPSQLVD
jgi:uncharacterized membrane protein YedE/YeeE